MQKYLYLTLLLQICIHQNDAFAIPSPSTFDFPSLEENVKVGGRDIVTHVKYVDASLRKLTGRGVCERMNIDLDPTTKEASSDVSTCSSSDDVYRAICKNDQYVLITHGTQADPIYNFGNVACLTAFHRAYDDLITMPSRLCVVHKSQDEVLRNELMTKVTNDGFVEGAYRGYRIRGDGKFIKLTNAVVWNCYGDDGVYIGQAALFDRNISPIVDSTDDE